jgi:hypothetical protein
MKHPIAWHEENLKNFNASLDAKRKELARITDEVFRMEQESDFRGVQIGQARCEGKAEFDGDRFCKRARA